MVTPQLQSEVMSAVTNREPIQFTEGTCVISSTVKICNVDGLRIEGAGREQTILRWENPADEGPMFELQNSSGVAFSELSACVHDPDPQDLVPVTLNAFADMYNACFDCDVDQRQQCDPSVSGYLPGGLPHSHGNSFTNMTIASCTGSQSVLNYGIRVKLYGERSELADTGDVSTECAYTLSGVQDLNNDGVIDDADYELFYEAEYAAWQDPAGDDTWATHLRADCYNEHHSFTTVSVDGFRESAFVLEGINSLGNSFVDVHCDGYYLDDPVQISGDCCGFSCIETGQNVWVYDDGNQEYKHEHVYFSNKSTNGHFKWYGGSATNISEAVFVLGYKSEPITIAGLHAGQSRSLVKALYPDLVRAELPLILESVNFDTGGVHAWDDSPPSLLSPNTYGIIIEVPYHGPLIMRDCLIDGSLQHPDGHSSEPPNVSIYWTFDRNPVFDPGSFLFEGNAVCSSDQNPFFPVDSVGDPYDEEPLPLYPTRQNNNLICTYESTAQGDHRIWETMPQHFTTVTADNLTAENSSNSMDVSRLATSRNFFITENNSSLSLGRLLNGVVGQEVMLFCGLGSTLEVVSDSDPNNDLPGEILLGDGNWTMEGHDVLMLVLDDDGMWREVTRGESP